MRRCLPTTVLCVAFFGLAACVATGTKMLQSWAEPGRDPLVLSKVVGVFLTKDDGLRKTVEDEMVHQIQMHKTKGAPGYSVLTEADLKDINRARTTLEAKGFDGAVVARLTGEDERSKWAPGDYPVSYYSMGDYCDFAWPLVAVFPSLASDASFRMEVNLYSLKDGKLVWSGRSETMNPAGIQDLLDDVARAVARDLKSKGLIQ